MKTSSFLQALAVLMGTIIGVGLFSLPYITSKVGLWIMLVYLTFLSGVVILTCWLYGEITLRTRKLCRLPGYASKYLGPWAKNLAFLSNSLGASGSLLAYIIVGGSFFYSFFSPFFGGDRNIYIFLYFLAGTILIFFGIKSIARTEIFFLVFLLFVLALTFWRGFSLIDLSYLFNFESRHLFLPYGATLFALAGMSIVPEIKEILKNREKDFKKAVSIAVLLSALIYLGFVVLVVGISGQNTSSEAISGLKQVWGDGVSSLMFLFGILTTFTSFIAIGLNFKKMLWYDLGLNKHLAWAIACFAPFLFYLLGVGNFITVISLTGGIFVAADVVLIILIYQKAKTKGELRPAYSIQLPKLLIYSLVFFFVLGIFYEIYYFVF